MAERQGVARTNYFRVVDIEGLRKALEPFDIDIQDHPTEPDHVMLNPGPYSQDGGFVSSITDDEGEELEFTFEDYVMPFVAEGEVVVMQECGAEGLRYISGYAQAYIRKGENVQAVSISIEGIYKRAAEQFGVTVDDIARCSYDDLPVSRQHQDQRPAPKG